MSQIKIKGFPCVILKAHTRILLHKGFVFCKLYPLAISLVINLI